jgi:hypothetical protein
VSVIAQFRLCSGLGFGQPTLGRFRLPRFLGLFRQRDVPPSPLAEGTEGLREGGRRGCTSELCGRQREGRAELLGCNRVGLDVLDGGGKQSSTPNC